ncbi:MAG: calcium-binding protein, partial [Planctomycetes bacterium]|nr:calcium-binding protein [Planctomycetota bacterium]
MTVRRFQPLSDVETGMARIWEDPNFWFPHADYHGSEIQGSDRNFGPGGGNPYVGNDEANSMMSTTGNDTLDGMNGNDTLFAGAGEDAVTGGGGNDVLFAGAGFDLVSGGDGADVLLGNQHNDTVIGGGGE